MFGFLFDVLLVTLFIYLALGVRFVIQAAVSEKAVGRTPKVGDLTLVGLLWLPLLITDPKDFNSVDVLRIRQERREQKGYERSSHLAAAQKQTVERQVKVEKDKAELEALRYKAQMETERHRQTVETFLNQRALKELPSIDPDGAVEAEIVFDHSDRSLPKRYQERRGIGDDKEVYDTFDDKWVPEWSMLPGYRWDQY